MFGSQMLEIPEPKSLELNLAQIHPPFLSTRLRCSYFHFNSQFVSKQSIFPLGILPRNRKGNGRKRKIQAVIHKDAKVLSLWSEVP